MSTDITIKYARPPRGLIHFYQHWIPSEPAALVVFVHGLGDHCGRYEAFIDRMVSEGFACAAYDQLGHGRSQGKRGHVKRFADWVDDLGSFANFSLAQVPEGTPLFIVGYSLGALIGIEYLLTHEQRVSGMVSISGAFLPTARIPKWKRRMATRLRNIVPKLSIENGVRREDLTRDPAQFEALRSDELFHDRLTLGAGREIESRLLLIGGMPQRIHEPMLMIAGTADRVCDPAGSRWFAERLASVDREWKEYEGMYHDMLHDTGREQVLDDISRWIHGRAADDRASEEQYPLKRGEGTWVNVS